MTSQCGGVVKDLEGIKKHARISSIYSGLSAKLTEFTEGPFFSCEFLFNYEFLCRVVRKKQLKNILNFTRKRCIVAGFKMKSKHIIILL